MQESKEIHKFSKVVMTKQVFDLIQRLEVEDGVPRVISSAINLIEGGVDLLWHGRAKLKDLGFTAIFEENKTSQYVGYRPRRADKGNRRYSLVLSQRKDGLLISVPQEFLEPFMLVLQYQEVLPLSVIDLIGDEDEYPKTQDYYWVRPSQEDLFLDASEKYRNVLQGEVTGAFCIDPQGLDPEHPPDCQKARLAGIGPFWDHSKYINELRTREFCLRATSDTLFPYCLQFFVTSSDVLEELLSYFAPKLMEV